MLAKEIEDSENYSYCVNTKINYEHLSDGMRKKIVKSTNKEIKKYCK